VYIDANVAIYTIENHPRYAPLLQPLWSAVSSGAARVLVSELALLESLVVPYRANNHQLAADYETFFTFPGIQLVPITQSVLREAARLRANIAKLWSPDAIHAATALQGRSTSSLTNDAVFESVPGLNVILLTDVAG
jgi:predicted nucleic acid-binding protein